MPPAARKKQQYECAAKEFELTREAMRALNIEADFKGLPLFETWSRYTERRQDNVITDNRKHNKNRIARAKAAAEAAAASEAGSSQAGPSVRDRSNTRSPMLAALTPRRLAQRTASVTALARTLRCAPKTLTELVDGAAEDHPSQTLSRIDAMLAPPDPNKPREVFRSDFKKQAIMWELRQSKLARQCALAVEPALNPADLTGLALPTGRALVHLRSCVCVWVLVACRGSRARVGPRVCGASAPPRLPVYKLGRRPTPYSPRTAPLLGRSGARLAPVRPPGGWKRGDG